MHFDSDVVVINESARTVDPSPSAEQQEQAKSFDTTDVIVHRPGLDCGDTQILNAVFPNLEPISWGTFTLLTFCASLP